MLEPCWLRFFLFYPYPFQVMPRNLFADFRKLFCGFLFFKKIKLIKLLNEGILYLIQYSLHCYRYSIAVGCPTDCSWIVVIISYLSWNLFNQILGRCTKYILQNFIFDHRFFFSRKSMHGGVLFKILRKILFFMSKTEIGQSPPPPPL